MTNNQEVFTVPSEEPQAPTQVTQPRQATKRTFVQTIAGNIIALVSFIGALAIFAPQFIEAIAPLLPANWLVYVSAVLAVIASVSAAVARIMAIPGVNEWLHNLNLSAEGNK